MPRPDLAGGPATHLPLLQCGLEELGVRIVTFNYTRRSDGEARWRKPIERGLDLLRLAILAMRHRPRLIHHNSAFDNGTFVRDALLCIVAWLLRTPVLIKVHGSHQEAFGPLTGGKRLFRYLTLRLSDAFGVLSLAELDEFRMTWPWLDGKLHVVRNVLRTEFLQATVRDHSRPAVVFTSRFVAQKGMFDLLEAAAQIVRQAPMIQFIFIGDGPDADRFRLRVTQLGLDANVTHHRHKTFDQLVDMYCDGGIFVFPTHFPEGMPMALVEAMAVGLLAISAPIRFAHQVPIFRQSPHLLLSHDEPFALQIVRVVLRVIGDDRFRESVGQANKEFASQYSKEAVAKEFCCLYERLTKQSR